MAALYASLVLFTVWVIRQPDTESRLVQGIDLAVGSAAIFIFVAGALRLARSASGRLRTAWCLLVAGQLTLLAADVVYTGLGFPAVSLADLFYIGMYPLMLTGVLMFPFVPLSRRDRLVLALDRLLVLLAGATFCWYVLVPSLQHWAALTLEAWVNAVYPPLELLLLAAAITLIQRDVIGIRRWNTTRDPQSSSCGLKRRKMGRTSEKFGYRNPTADCGSPKPTIRLW